MADFTITDISSAVASATATVLGGSERKALTQATHAAHKGGMGVVPAFKASWPGAPAPKLTPQIEKAFDTAVQKAKAERLAKKGSGSSGSTLDPAAQKKADLKAAETTARTTRGTIKNLVEEAKNAAKAAEDDAKAAEEAATEAEGLRKGSPEAIAARLAAGEAKKAAGEARSASDEANTQLEGADGSLKIIQGIVIAKGNLTDTEKPIEDIDEVHMAVGWNLDTANEKRREASDARGRAEAQRDKLKPIDDPQKKKKEEDRKKWLQERGPVFGLLAAALVVVMIAAAFGLPAWIPVGMLVTSYLIAVPAVAIWTGVQEPPAGRFPAGLLAIGAVALLVLALQGGDGNSATKKEELTPTPPPTIVVNFGIEGGFTPAPTFTPVPTPTPNATPTATSTP